MDFVQLVEADDDGDGVHHRAGGAAFGEFVFVVADGGGGHVVGQDADCQVVEFHAVELERVERMAIAHQCVRGCARQDFQPLSRCEVEGAFGEQPAHDGGACARVDGGDGLHAVEFHRNDDVMDGIGLEGHRNRVVRPRRGAGRAMFARQHAHPVVAEIEVEIEIVQEVGRDGAREMVDPGAALLGLQHEAHRIDPACAQLQIAHRHELIEHDAIGQERLFALGHSGGRQTERARHTGRQRGEGAARIDHEDVALGIDGDRNENGAGADVETRERVGAAIFGMRCVRDGCLQHRERCDGGACETARVPHATSSATKPFHPLI